MDLATLLVYLAMFVIALAATVALAAFLFMRFVEWVSEKIAK